MTTQSHKIPLWCFIIDAHRLLWRDRVAVARFAAPWFLLLIIGDVVINWAYFPRHNQQDTAYLWPDLLYDVGGMALPMVIGAIVSVLLHRHILLHNDKIGCSHPNAPPKLVTSYLGRAIAIQVFFFGPLAIAAIVAITARIYIFGGSEPDAGQSILSRDWTADFMLMGLAVLFFILVSYVPVRISLALPATAIGSVACTFRQSWLITRGNFWRMFSGVILSNWPSLMVLAFILSRPMAESQTELQFIANTTATTLVISISDIIEVAFLSLAYRNIVPPDGQET